MRGALHMAAAAWLGVLPAIAVAATAPDTSGIRYDPHPGARLPLAAPFRDETGRATTLLQAAGGAPTVLAIGYFHCPALCGIVRADLMQALAASGLATPAQYRLVALSIDPAETFSDAAQAKAEDLARFPTTGAADGWHFLTGGAASIGAITTAIGFHARYDASLKQFIHPAGLVFITRRAAFHPTCSASATSRRTCARPCGAPAPMQSARPPTRFCCCASTSIPPPAATPSRSPGCCAWARRCSWPSPP